MKLAVALAFPILTGLAALPSQHSTTRPIARIHVDPTQPRVAHLLVYTSRLISAMAICTSSAPTIKTFNCEQRFRMHPLRGSRRSAAYRLGPRRQWSEQS